MPSQPVPLCAFAPLPPYGAKVLSTCPRIGFFIPTNSFVARPEIGVPKLWTEVHFFSTFVFLLSPLTKTLLAPPLERLHSVLLDIRSPFGTHFGGVFTASPIVVALLGCTFFFANHPLVHIPLAGPRHPGNISFSFRYWVLIGFLFPSWAGKSQWDPPPFRILRVLACLTVQVPAWRLSLPRASLSGLFLDQLLQLLSVRQRQVTGRGVPL